MELATSEAISTPGTEGMGEWNRSGIRLAKRMVDLGRDVLSGTKTPQRGSWGIHTPHHSPVLGCPSGAFHWRSPPGKPEGKKAR